MSWYLINRIKNDIGSERTAENGLPLTIVFIDLKKSRDYDNGMKRNILSGVKLVNSHI